VHGENGCEGRQAGGEKTGIATGDYSKKYVQEQVQRYNDGEITVLVATYSLLGEGFDVPFLNRAFITSPFRAEAKAEQLIGRIQRTHPGKKDAIVYDYVDVDIGVVKNQFYSKTGTCRHATYEKLGVNVEPY
jgi:superfamily II DNA or RNA helicase